MIATVIVACCALVVSCLAIVVLTLEAIGLYKDRKRKNRKRKSGPKSRDGS
jgi:hypothetical protein